MSTETNPAERHSTDYDAAPKCAHCGHVRGLHGRNHGCISALADGVPGRSCACPGYVTPPAVPAEPDAGDVRKTPLPKDGPITRGGECFQHGAYSIGPDCPECVREVLEWTS